MTEREKKFAHLSNPQHSVYQYTKQQAFSYFDMKHWRDFLILGYPIVLPATKIQSRFYLTVRNKEADNQNRQLQNNGLYTTAAH
jgi:hypothetical protein